MIGCGGAPLAVTWLVVGQWWLMVRCGGSTPRLGKNEVWKESTLETSSARSLSALLFFLTC